VAKGILLDFEGTVARRTDGHLGPCTQEIRNLGYDVYRPELQAAYDYVLRVEFPRKGHDNVEAFVEAVMKHLGHKVKRTELMALAPLFAEYHRFTLYEDATRAIPALAESRKVAVLSALPSYLVSPVLEPLGTRVAVVTPKEAKAALPNPKVYEHAAQVLRLKVKDVAVVSADCEDGLAIPKALGFRTVHVRREPCDPCPHASSTIASLVELEAVLRAGPSKAEAPASTMPSKALDTAQVL
jgi:FMN phosphatase YigB (HAD superfamily)